MSDLTSQYIIAQEEHDYNEKYEEGTIVKHTIDDVVTAYVAKKNVPQFISILNKKYWKKVASTSEGAGGKTGLSYGGSINTQSSIQPDTTCYYIAEESGFYQAFGVTVNANERVQALVYDGTSWDVVPLNMYNYGYAHGKFDKLDDIDSLLTDVVPSSASSSNKLLTERERHFKGWFNSLAELKTAHIATKGDSAYVKDASPATTWSIYVYDATATTDNYWADSGTDADTSNVQTFATGEEVNEVHIDNEPTAGSGNLVKSGGIIKYAKQVGITFEEKDTFECVGISGKGVLGSNGSIVSGYALGVRYTEIPIIGYSVIKFLGYKSNTPLASNSTGYAFGHYEGNNWVTDYSSFYPYDTSLTSSIPFEIIEDIPSGATHFRTMCSFASNSFGGVLQGFYIELLNGTNVKIFYHKENGKGVFGATGLITPIDDEDYSYSEIKVEGFTKVRFLGYKRYTPSASNSTGYAFGHYASDGTWVTDKSYFYPYDETLTHSIPFEIIEDIPENATRFRTMSSFSGNNHLSGFYILLQKGKDIKDVVEEITEDKVNEKVDEKLNETSLQYTLNAGKSINAVNASLIGDEISLSNHHSTSYIDVRYFSKIRFLGLRYKNSYYNGSNLTVGFAFYNENKIALEPYCHTWYLGEDENAEEVGMPYVYEINVPKGAYYFRCDTRDSDTTAAFYCIGISEIQSSLSNLSGESFVNIEPILRNTSFNRNSATKTPSFNLIHFSDIHGDTIALQRIVDFKNKFKDYITDVLCTGDNVWYNFSHGMDFWDAVEGSESILNCLGNHDTTTIGGYHSGDVSAADCYNKFFAPYIANWGNVVITENQCYYYKDYPSYNIRLIVLDIYHPDDTSVVSDTLGTAQLTWFESVLEDARTAETPLHVIVAGHCTERYWNEHLDTPFDDLQRANDIIMDNRLPALGADTINAISDFIENGGNFVCYLAGHMHSDSFRKFNGHNNMLSVVVQNASVMEHNPGAAHGTIARLSTGPDNTNARVIGEVSEDAFNLISVDTLHSILTITRIGQNYDVFGRHLGSVCYDYSANRIISQW